MAIAKPIFNARKAKYFLVKEQRLKLFFCILRRFIRSAKVGKSNAFAYFSILKLAC